MSEELPLMKRFLCGLYSPLGYLYSFLVGSGYTCPCCAFWRGVIWGAIAMWMVMFFFY